MPTKKINGFSRYTISDNGKVVNIKTGRVIKSNIDRYGYEIVNIRSDQNIDKHLYIHRIVALNFLQNPELKPQVNHIDGNKRNNNLYNLEWCTVKENISHAVKNGLANIKGERNHFSVLTENAVLEIRSKGKYSSYRQIANDYNMSSNAIVEILKRKTWKHI